jgi:hypothetical protein
LLHAVFGTPLPAQFSHLLLSSSQSYSLHFRSRSPRRQQASQVASPVLLAPAPLRQELNTLAA